MVKFHKYMYPYRYRRTKVGGLTDLVNVVNSSATVNTTQLVGSAEGMVIVPTYDWQSFLGENLNKLVGIKSFHHLRFSHDHKGSVYEVEVGFSRSRAQALKTRLVSDFD